MEIQEINHPTKYGLINWVKSQNVPGLRYLSHRLPMWILPKPSGECIVNTMHGFKLLINPVIDNGLERNLYYTGTYESATLRTIKRLLEDGSTFLDVGANIGLMSIFASKILKNNGNVIAIEANPSTMEILKKNIAMNNLNNIEAISTALGSQKSTGRIYSNISQNRGSASLVNIDTSTESFEIDIVPFDQLNIKNKLKISLIKMDIEGYELEALKGMQELLSSANAPNLIVECGESIPGIESSKTTVYNFIRGVNDYTIYKLVGGKSRGNVLKKAHKESELPSHDNIICIHESRKYLLRNFILAD